MSDYWRESREITERIVVEGDLVLLTPASLGNGDADGLTDMSLLLDEFEGKALLTGTSIAGALRNYLRECSLNYGISEESKYKDEKRESVNVPLPIITQIFGSLEDDGAQSLLIVDDAIGGVPRTELRDGVKIDGKMRTAEDGKKFDLELLEAGTSFPLRFELLICEQKGKDAEERKRKTEEFKTDLLKAFAAALQGFETGEIHLGARKRRGYGECEIKKWRVKTFKLCGDQDGLIDWLKNGAKPLSGSGIAEQTSIAAALKVSPIADRREYFEMNACFALEGSMLIRSG
ncbi:MAG TPA: RAMP superfamily CRISPR-associated protein, partial [Pyrinomonadaceae bacterium]|nr:RAMP superfamily CRISPR-associated protein [Pyrinomonadaceae bacterium]